MLWSSVLRDNFGAKFKMVKVPGIFRKDLPSRMWNEVALNWMTSKPANRSLQKKILTCILGLGLIISSNFINYVPNF